ncbi:hypothetical protein EU546_01030 [Candidatus Thorarchaeota archaeon]|jgi:hypothetical protein|nr:MAG: hypothetical protein EU546_01030 [Candidatus Thorarchaeota archaeon]
MGMTTRVIGLAFTAMGAFVLFTSVGTSDPFGIIWSFVGMFVMALGLTLMTQSGKKEKKPPPPTVTEIRCDGCDFKEIRDFEEGDYILKALETTCPKCQGSMTIEGVYVVREEPDEKDEI